MEKNYETMNEVKKEGEKKRKRMRIGRWIDAKLDANMAVVKSLGRKITNLFFKRVLLIFSYFIIFLLFLCVLSKMGCMILRPKRFYDRPSIHKLIIRKSKIVKSNVKKRKRAVGVCGI